MDLNKDGNPDIVSGSYHGGLFIFYGKPGMEFKQKQVLVKEDPKDPILSKFVATTAGFIDMDGDKDLDMIVANIGNSLFFVENISDNIGVKMGKPQRIKTSSGKPLRNPGRKGGVCIADWDNDGKKDLILGSDMHGVFFFKNVGKDGKVVFADPVRILKCTPAKNYRYKPAVTDWNNDGLPDLIIGNFYTKKPENGGRPKLLGDLQLYLRKK